MANLATKYGSPDYRHTILMMMPTGGEPTFELAQYGSHNVAMLDPQTEPRLDLYQVKDDGIEGQYNPNKRRTMRNTGFTPPSQRVMDKISKIGETQPMLDENGAEIGKVVQFSASVDLDKNGYATGINSRSIAPADTSRGELPKGANLLQDIAKRANNDYQDAYLNWERTGEGRPPLGQGLPGVNDHDVVQRANRDPNQFGVGDPVPTHWARYATENPTPPAGQFTGGGPFGGFGAPRVPDMATSAKNYLDNARPEADIEPDTAASREQAAASFGAHNPVKPTTRNFGWDTAYDSSGRQTGTYNPVANRGMPSGGFGAPPAQAGFGRYDYQSTGLGYDNLPEGVSRESGLGHELGTHQEAQRRDFQQEMRRRSEPRSAKLKRMFDNSMDTIIIAAQKMTGTYRSPEQRFADMQEKLAKQEPQPQFGQGRGVPEPSGFGGGFGMDGAPGGTPFGRKSNPFTSAMDAQREQTTGMDTHRSGFNPSPFGQPRAPEKDAGPSFG